MKGYLLTVAVFAGLAGCVGVPAFEALGAARPVPPPEAGPAPHSSLLSAVELAELQDARSEAMAFQERCGRLEERDARFTSQLAQQEWGTLRHRIYPHIGHGPQDQRWVSLTFDDGPDPQVTPRVLDALRAAGVKATFFLIGRKAEQYPDLVRRIVAEGHAIGDHTYDHLYVTRISPESARVELDTCAKVIQTITGRWPRYYRPPGGHFDRTVVQIGRQLGMLLVTWTTSVGDYADPPTMTLLEHALSATRPGALLIWHDDIPETAQVLPWYLKKAREMGFRFVPLSDYERT